MKYNENIKIIITIVIIIFIAYSLFYWFVVGSPRARILCNTNYVDLLQACRSLTEKFETGELKPGTYKIMIKPDPEVSQFPELLLKLKPNYIHIDENDGGVLIEMIGGLGHLGIIACPEDFVPPSTYDIGDKELIPGLWYYDDGYENPKYYKKIDKLIKKNKHIRLE